MTTKRAPTCEYAVRLPGHNADGSSAFRSGYGDSATLCRKPASEVRRRTPSGTLDYVVNRCQEHYYH